MSVVGWASQLLATLVEGGGAVATRLGRVAAEWLKLPGAHHRGEWRRVPQIDLLAPGRRRPAPNLAALAVLAVLLLLGGYWLQNRYVAKVAVDGATERTTVEMREAQKELSAEQAEIQRLRGQIDQLTAQQRPQEPVAESVDWGPALTALFRAGASVITFQSIQGKAGGELTVDGTLPDVQALARFEAAMREVSHLIDVQSLEWDQQKNGLLTLTATIKERR